MQLRNRKSYLNSLPEGNAPVSRFSRLVHWSYYVILIAVILYFGRYIYYRLTSIEGYGQVVVEQVVLSASYGGNIMQLPVFEGQEISKGTQLVNIGSLKSCLEKENATILKLRLETEMKKAKLNALRVRLKEINSAQLMHRALELNSRNIESASDLQFDIGLLARELDIQIKLLTTLTKQKLAQQISRDCRDELINAPFDAYVRRILKKTHEFVERAGAILIIENKQADVHIEGYLSKYEMGSVVLNKQMIVEFPDGNKGIGVIKQVDAAAYAFPEREWEQYEPVDTRLRVYLTPADQQQAELWKQYNLLRVQIRGSL